jgi:mono/diheme cytochrome c family protein
MTRRCDAEGIYMNVKWIGIVGFGCMLVASSASAQDAKVAQGEKLYAQHKCSMCHAVAGKGNAKGPLDDAGTKYTAEELRQWLINPGEMAVKAKSTRKPPMPAYAKLSKEDVEALVAYMQTLKKK